MIEPYEWQIVAELIESHMLSEATRRGKQLDRAKLTSTPVRESEARFLGRMQVFSNILKKVRENGP